MKALVAVAAPIDDPPSIMERLRKEFEVVRIGVGDERPRDLEADPGRIAALVTTSHVGVPEWTWGLSGLKVIGNFGVGYDGIDTKRAAGLGVWVTNTPGVLADAVADLALGLMLALVRRIPQAERYARDGRWETDGDFHLVTDFNGMQIGMLGMGGIGREIAARAAAFKTKVSYCSRNPKDVPWRYEPDLLGLAGWSDLLCCIVPGDDSTDGLVEARVLEALGPNGYLVNVGRGNVVSEPALVAALRGRGIAGAALDVYADEPRIPESLRSMENVVIQPHVGSATNEARGKMGDLVIDNLLAVLGGGRPLTPVNEVA